MLQDAVPIYLISCPVDKAASHPSIQAGSLCLCCGIAPSESTPRLECRGIQSHNKNKTLGNSADSPPILFAADPCLLSVPVYADTAQHPPLSCSLGQVYLKRFVILLSKTKRFRIRGGLTCFSKNHRPGDTVLSVPHRDSM